MNRIKKSFTAAFLTLLLIALVVTPAINSSAADTDFSAAIKVGFDGRAEMSKYVPFAVSVESHTNDFQGRLQLIVGNKVNYNILYETDFSITRGEKKTVTFSCKVVDSLGRVNVRLVDKKGKTVWSQEKRFTVDKSASQKVDVGILSDDYSALGYMDNVEIAGYPGFKTNLVELTADSFPEDVNSLDMLEVIVISNFSADVLTDDQISALNLWVNRGGFLIVGTGVNSSKTLSKINGNIVDVKPNKMNRYSTTFGLEYYGSAYVNVQNTPQNDPYSDDQFLQEFNDYYSNCREEVDRDCLQDFMSSYGISEYELDPDGTVPDYWENDYYDYCMFYYYSFYYSPTPQTPIAYAEATADVLEFDDTTAKYYPLYGDSPNGDYILARVYPLAEGYVAIYGIDFTMNPIPGYKHNSELIEYVIRNYVIQKVSEYYDSIANGYGYYSVNFGYNNQSYAMDQFLEDIATAPLPPLIFYVLPIIAYMVLILVAYLVNKKKGKTFRLWYWYPILAIGLAVVIFCIGFSTRIIRPRINTMTILKLQAPAISEKNYVAVTTPSNKVCEVGFTTDYDVQLIRQINTYLYDNSDRVDLDSYRVAFRREVDQNYVRFSGNVALSTDQFLLQTVYPGTRDIKAEYVTNVSAQYAEAEKLILKNETDLDLENAIVICAGQPNSYGTTPNGDTTIFRIGDWKAGETFDMTAQQWKKGQNCGTQLDEIAFNQSEKHTLEGFFFGSLSDKFSQYINRKNLLEFAVNSAEDEAYANAALNAPPSNQNNYYSSRHTLPDDVIYVFGFPKEPVGKEIQPNGKYRNEKTEVVVKRIYYSEMKEVKH